MSMYIKPVFRNFYQLISVIGWDPRKTLHFFRGLPLYLRDCITYFLQSRKKPLDIRVGMFKPCVTDRYAQSGSVDSHYFYQDLFVANKVFKNNPQKHVDIGSRIDGFVTHVASFRAIQVMDIRPFHLDVDNLSFVRADLMSEDFGEFANYCDSLSCLHALEHFGLGRYGDPVRHDGHEIGFKNLISILKPGGKLYLSVPIGPQYVQFNAHRVFSVKYMLEMLGTYCDIDSISVIDDAGCFSQDVNISEKDVNNNFNCKYGCGIFECTKR